MKKGPPYGLIALGLFLLVGAVIGVFLVALSSEKEDLVRNVERHVAIDKAAQKARNAAPDPKPFEPTNETRAIAIQPMDNFNGAFVAHTATTYKVTVTPKNGPVEFAVIPVRDKDHLADDEKEKLAKALRKYGAGESGLEIGQARKGETFLYVVRNRTETPVTATFRIQTQPVELAEQAEPVNTPPDVREPITEAPIRVIVDNVFNLKPSQYVQFPIFSPVEEKAYQVEVVTNVGRFGVAVIKDETPRLFTREEERATKEGSTPVPEGSTHLSRGSVRPDETWVAYLRNTGTEPGSARFIVRLYKKDIPAPRPVTEE